MSQRQPQPRHSERGFTLVELMYATGYFMIGLAALASFQIVAATGSGRANDISNATNLAASTIEMVRASNFNTVLTTVQPMVATYDRYGNLTSTPAFYSVSATSTVASPTYFTVTTNCSQVAGAGYYEIVVQANWKQNPSATFVHGITMQTRIPTE